MNGAPSKKGPRRSDARAAEVLLGDPETFEATVADLYQPVELVDRSRGRFKAAIAGYQVDEAFVSRVEASPHQFRFQDAAGRAEGGLEADIKTFVPLGGVVVLRQQEREVSLEPGRIGLVDASVPYQVLAEPGFRTLILVTPRKALGLRPTDAAELSAATLESSSLHGVVAPYLTGLADNLSVLAGSPGRKVAHTAVELVSTLLHNQLGSRLPPAKEFRGELLDRAHRLIDENLADRALSPRTIAAALHVSVRYLHSVFSDSGTTVQAYVKRRRLVAARQDLTDPRYAHEGISVIAARWAFSDAPHFTRAFRQAFGATPAEYRRSAPG